jgi:DASS family divalent anion:Na+ symporter
MIGSEPGANSKRSGGEFLHLCGAHANMLMSAMFLSGMPGNPLVQVEAQKILDVDFSYIVWLKGSIIPCAVIALTLPIILNYLSPAKVNLKALQGDIRRELTLLGPMTFNEMKLTGTLAAMLILWITSDWTHISAELVALAGVFFLLYTETLKWKNVLENKGAWGIVFLRVPFALFNVDF